jgi:hypothetical protein
MKRKNEVQKSEIDYLSVLPEEIWIFILSLRRQYKEKRFFFMRGSHVSKKWMALTGKTVSGLAINSCDDAAKDAIARLNHIQTLELIYIPVDPLFLSKWTPPPSLKTFIIDCFLHSPRFDLDSFHVEALSLRLRNHLLDGTLSRINRISFLHLNVESLSNDSISSICGIETLNHLTIEAESFQSDCLNIQSDSLEYFDFQCGDRFAFSISAPKLRFLRLCFDFAVRTCIRPEPTRERDRVLMLSNESLSKLTELLVLCLEDIDIATHTLQNMTSLKSLHIFHTRVVDIASNVPQVNYIRTKPEAVFMSKLREHDTPFDYQYHEGRFVHLRRQGEEGHFYDPLDYFNWKKLPPSDFIKYISKRKKIIFHDQYGKF